MISDQRTCDEFQNDDKSLDGSCCQPEPIKLVKEASSEISNENTRLKTELTITITTENIPEKKNVQTSDKPDSE